MRAAEPEIHAGDTLYIHWQQSAQSVNVTIAPPVCDTEVQFINEYAAGGGNSNKKSQGGFFQKLFAWLVEWTI